MKTRLEKHELFPDKLPNSFLNRVNETISYLDNENISGNIADIGEKNPMCIAIEKHFNITIDSVNFDFNYSFNMKKEYDVILCFEVLEHLFNPLLFLEQLKGMLTKGGVIYLSTPYQKPQILKAIHHYHEIPSDRIEWLFNAAKLNIKSVKNITIAGNWHDHIYGIRPILRYFQKTRMYKLKSK